MIFLPPNGECLKDVCDRVIPFFKETILPKLMGGKTVLVSAHGNSLRALIKDIEHISDEKIPFLELATGKPIIFDFTDGVFTRQ